MKLPGEFELAHIARIDLSQRRVIRPRLMLIDTAIPSSDRRRRQRSDVSGVPDACHETLLISLSFSDWRLRFSCQQDLAYATRALNLSEDKDDVARCRPKEGMSFWSRYFRSEQPRSRPRGQASCAGTGRCGCALSKV